MVEGTCQACTDIYCADCADDAGTCTGCKDGNWLYEGVCVPDNDYAAAFIRSVSTTPDFTLDKFGPANPTTEDFSSKYTSSLLGFDIFNLHSTETGDELPSTYLSNIVSDITEKDQSLYTGFFIIKNI